MEYITLKNTDIKVSRLCMGGCPMGQYGWGKVDENELIEAIHTAIDSGITMFDTADVYGLGKSEETLSKGLGNRRKDVVIASKFGVRMENGITFYDNSPKYINEALSASLKRLHTDYIDLYQVHYRDGNTPVDEVIGTLEELKQKGSIRAYGFSNLYGNELSDLEPYKGKIASLQNEYSLACRKHEHILTAGACQLQFTPMTWGSLGQGILSGKYNENSLFGMDDRRSRDTYVNFHGEKLKKNMEIVKVLGRIAENHSVSSVAVALRFILESIEDSVALVGIKRKEQVYDIVEASELRLFNKELDLLFDISV